MLVRRISLNLMKSKPAKICVTCGLPFTWRKKWERCWDEVTACSKSCNSKRKGRKTSQDNVTKDGKIISQSKLNASDEKDRAISMLEANFVDVNIGGAFVTNDFKERELEELFENVTPDTHLNSDISNEDDYQTMTSQNTKINESEDEYEEDQYSDSKARRKAEKKRMKAERHAQREGKGNPTAGQKQCTICSKSVDLLIRCQYDVTEQWGMVCGKCWNDVSGGVVDGDAAHPYYRYGGLWKNRRAQKACRSAASMS